MRRTLRLLAVLALAIASLTAIAQVATATLPVGSYPIVAAVNTSTNQIYVVNVQCYPLPCSTQGTVTVINGNTNTIVSTVNVGYTPVGLVVNPTTNTIYVANVCGNDPTCQSLGTVTVINGATLQTQTVTVGYAPGFSLHGMAINQTTNTIYIANYCSGGGGPYNCQQPCNGTVTVIDGSTLGTQTVPAGCGPVSVAIDPQTNMIYVANAYDANNGSTVTVINGNTLTTQTVPVGYLSYDIGVDPTTNQIYVSNLCGSDPTCQGSGTVTVIDGATLNTRTVAAGYEPVWIAVNPGTNTIYAANNCANSACSTPTTVTVINGTTLDTTAVPTLCTPGLTPGDLEVNTVTNKIYMPCNTTGTLPAQSVTVIDGATNNAFPIAVGDQPDNIAINSVTDTLYTPSFFDNTISVIGGATKAQLNTVTPCRLVDTRPQSGGSGPIPGGTFEAFNLPQQAQANCPGLNLSGAISYSLNVTLIPSNGPVSYLTIWPDSLIQPVVSTMNSDGRTKANAAIVSAGLAGAVDVYVAQTANVLLDIDGYFGPSGSSTLQFYPLTPCRIADTRSSNEPPGLGAPSLQGGVARSFPLLNASTCFQQVPQGVTVAAYSLNFTAVPHGQPLGYVTVWPTGESQPTVSTLNDRNGVNTANAAVVPAGTSGAVSVYPSANTDLLIDINGYFAAPGAGGLSVYPTPPCRVLDTRSGTGPFSGMLSPPVNVLASPCGVPSQSQAYTFNATVVPYLHGLLGYLTLWPDGESQPTVSTLNAPDGAITSNMAIVPAGTQGMVDAFAGNGTTNLILDISSFYAP
jgi:DNA-binding beta-propeller fold protein YncE